MLENAINNGRFNLVYGAMLVDDIEPDKFAHQPAAGMNSPAWVIGHLALINDRVIGLLGAERQHGSWDSLFAARLERGADPEQYPSKDTLIEAWRATFDRLIAAIQSADASIFDGPNPVERMKSVAPSFADFIVFILTTHAAVHLGQVSAWRRVDGRPPLF